CIVDAKEEYNEEVNLYLNFIKKNIILETDQLIKKSLLLEAYKMYVKNNNQKYVAKNVEKEFDKLYKTKIIREVKYYMGVRLRSDDDNDADLDNLDGGAASAVDA